MISLPRCNKPWKASLPKIHRKPQHKARIRLVRETLHIWNWCSIPISSPSAWYEVAVPNFHQQHSYRVSQFVGNRRCSCLKMPQIFARKLLATICCYTMTMTQLWRTLPTSRVFKCELKNIYQRWWMMMICESNYHSWPSLMQFQSIIVHHPFPLTIPNQYQRSYKTESNIIKHPRISKESMSLQFTSWIR